MGISYVEAKTDLVMNKLTREIYEDLRLSGLLRDDQLYFITDDKPISEVISSYLSSYYPKSETSGAVELSAEFQKHLLSTDVSLDYASSDRLLRLKAFGKDISTVDCSDFIKDGMLSSAELCGKVLVLTFNTDAGKTPISISLSSFVDNYDSQISTLSSAISTIGSDYLDSNDKIDILNRCIERDEIKFYYGPEQKQISLSVFTGEGQPEVQTVTLSDFYSKSETSSSQQVQDKFSTLSTYSEIRDQLSNDNYATKTLIKVWREI